jgi:hypothetical protein
MASAFAAATLAAFAVRSPMVWPLFPDWIFQVFMLVLDPQNQEEVGDVEFLGFWAGCLGALALVGVAYRLAKRYLLRASSSENAA